MPARCVPAWLAGTTPPSLGLPSQDQGPLPTAVTHSSSPALGYRHSPVQGEVRRRLARGEGRGRVCGLLLRTHEERPTEHNSSRDPAAPPGGRDTWFCQGPVHLRRSPPTPLPRHTAARVTGDVFSSSMCRSGSKWGAACLPWTASSLSVSCFLCASASRSLGRREAGSHIRDPHSLPRPHTAQRTGAAATPPDVSLQPQPPRLQQVHLGAQLAEGPAELLG